MPAQQIEIKFSSTLTHALHALKCALARPSHFSPVVLLCHSKEFLDELYLTLQTLINADGHDVSLFHWQAWEHAPFSPVTSSITQKIERLKTLEALKLQAAPTIILASVDSWIQPTLPKGVYESLHSELIAGSDIGSREELRSKLRALGYTQAETVEEPGQFAIRGEIFDLFIPTQPAPSRVEFFDTLIETIRPFHPETQRTLKTEKPIERICITPAEEVIFPWTEQASVLEVIKEYSDQHQISRKVRDPIFENIRNGFLPDNYRVWIPFIYSSYGALSDYLPDDSTLIIFEPEQIQIELRQTLESLKKEEARYDQPHWISPEFNLLYSRAPELIETGLQKANLVARVAPLNEHAKPPIATEAITQERLTEKEVFEWLDDGFFVWVGSRGLTHQERLKFLLKRVQNNPFFKILSRDTGESLQFLTEKTVVISESLFFGRSAQPPKKSSRAPVESAFKEGETEAFSQPSDLSVGDFVVHAVHGVGKYLGLQELAAQGNTLGEYLLIEYSGGDKLYLPVYRLNTIQKYVGAGGNPSVDKLGTQQFEKAKQKARESAKKLAINLVEIYAKRATLKGEKFVEQGQDYLDFADEFEFTETEGQINAIQATLADLEAGKLLDRLVCGDVGFGKTEVAMRAAFQAVQSGFQVAVLVPTTLLAFQHEQSFKRRMKSFPIRIESISRFKTKKQQTELIRELAEGQIDIMIGTHRLLSKDVQWNHLGILIVDEEHRFGVEHKEKMKAIQANTHSLTMTATPIPRTLNMALSGLKEISLIKTPPTNRQPIKTYVSHASDELIKSAIENELSRGGQVFYLYNRVQTIENRAKELRELMPHARIIVAHGQMSEGEIEQKMIEFYQGHAQILLCTTIIESGIDVPNAGTIIIHRADQLGLAQLYQIRGRVGRSHRKAFAYLLVDEERTLTQEAKMRLDVLQRFVELGAGFQIASHDLEIRGGGNFLGAEQSGHIASVGMDLFTELLEEAIQELQGKKIDVEERHYEPEIQVPVVCEIDADVVSDPKLRLSFYRKLSNARSNNQVDTLFEEFKDRFGKVPEKTENLFWLIRIKNLLKQVGIDQLSVSVARASMTVRKTTLIEIDEVMKLYAGPKNIRDPRVSITPDSKIVLQLPFESLQSHLFELENLFKKIAPKAFENPKTLIN
jgi:transcription-repair coupling factor (superfamily II helicase)